MLNNRIWAALGLVLCVGRVSGDDIDGAALRQATVGQLRSRIGYDDAALAAMNLSADRLGAVLSAAYGSYDARQASLDGLFQSVGAKQTALSKSRRPPGDPVEIARCVSEAAAAEAALLAGLQEMQAAMDAQSDDGARAVAAAVRSNAGLDAPVRYLSLTGSVASALSQACRARDAELARARQAQNRAAIKQLWSDYTDYRDGLLSSLQKQQAAGYAFNVSNNLAAVSQADAQAAAGR